MGTRSSSNMLVFSRIMLCDNLDCNSELSENFHGWNTRSTHGVLVVVGGEAALLTSIWCSFLATVYSDSDNEDNRKTMKTLRTGVRLYSSDELDREEAETLILYLPVESELWKRLKNRWKVILIGLFLVTILWSWKNGGREGGRWRQWGISDTPGRIGNIIRQRRENLSFKFSQGLVKDSCKLVFLNA